MSELDTVYINTKRTAVASKRTLPGQPEPISLGDLREMVESLVAEDVPLTAVVEVFGHDLRGSRGLRAEWPGK